MEPILIDWRGKLSKAGNISESIRQTIINDFKARACPILVAMADILNLDDFTWGKEDYVQREWIQVKVTSTTGFKDTFPITIEDNRYLKIGWVKQDINDPNCKFDPATILIAVASQMVYSKGHLLRGDGEFHPASANHTTIYVGDWYLTPTFTMKATAQKNLKIQHNFTFAYGLKADLKRKK